MNDRTTNLGTFEVQAPGQLHITDPCYDKGTWCAVWGLRARPGPWKGSVAYHSLSGWGARVSILYAEHDEREQAPWTKLEGEIGVDSGQAGIFDASAYPPGETGEHGDLNTFYGRACSATNVHEMGGIIPGGVVSLSGVGDGSYDAFACRDSDGRVTGVLILFLEEAASLAAKIMRTRIASDEK